jgi:hypothetical protein
MLRKIIKEQLLLEKKIAQIKSNITINYDLRHDERNDHSQKRKWRHVGETGGEKIYDFDIKKLVEASIDEITFNIAMEQITDSVRFIVSSVSSPYLNIIIEPKMNNPYDWVLYVISVMNKKDYKIGKGQLQIFK